MMTDQVSNIPAEVIQRVLMDFESELAGIKTVEMVEFSAAGDLLTIQTIGNHLSDEDEDKVYAAERSLYSKYPTIDLSFRLLERADRHLVGSDM